jgi:AraC-like DNA-binding protein
MLSVRTTLTDRTSPFESKMFSNTQGFALSHDHGHVRVDAANMGGPDLRLFRVQSSGHQMALQEDASVSFLFPRAGQLRMRVLANEYRVAPQMGMFFGPNARQTKVVPPTGSAFRAGVLMTPWARLRDLLMRDADAGPVPPDFADGVPLGPALPSYQRLANLLAHIIDQFDQPTLVPDRAVAAYAVLVDEFSLAVMDEHLQIQQDRRPVPTSMMRVRQAEEIMRARRTEPLSILDIAAELGVGMRSLQLAFMAARAMGPRDVLMRMRLEQARERLLAAQSGDTVTVIVLDCGFTHLGRFSGAYRRAYGETPGETLSRHQSCSRR